MKTATYSFSLFLMFLLPSVVLAQTPWWQVSFPTVSQAAASFATPPVEYGPVHWAFWGGNPPVTKERITADLEQIHANGGTQYMINNSNGLRPLYFTPEYMELVKHVVQECKRLGMKVWIEGDAGYPDGFAGGMISKRYPELGMQGMIADAKYTVVAGQTLDIPLPENTLGIVVNPRASTRPGATATATATPATPATPAQVIPVPTGGRLKWTAPAGQWEITFVRAVLRSSPTRFVNREDGTRDKDSRYGLIDYLNPEATNTYLKLIFDEYEKLVGDEFGKTIMGFRGDEPDYTGFLPWSPKLPEVFLKEKGYDIRPHIASFFAGVLTPEAKRAKADYFDVWSGMFRDNFFKPIEDWCKARDMEYMMHLNHEEIMISPRGGEDLIQNEGSLWRAMRYTGVPGIDNLNQIRPGRVMDFPKLASSVAHLFGYPLIWTEQGGSTGQNGKFVADHQLVRGINLLNVSGLNAKPTEALNPASMGWYTRRASYLLGIGRPAVQVALYHPTESMWLGDRASDSVTVKLSAQLMEQQIDFDYIDEESLGSLFSIEKGGIKNLSGNMYRAIIIPTSTVIYKKVLDRLRTFVAAGGKVVFVGSTPSMIVEKTFLDAKGTPDLSFATLLEPKPEITQAVVAALPPSDVKLNEACASLKYIHRSLKDGEVYFFFNESDQKVMRTATVAGKGKAQVWDAFTGKITAQLGAQSGKRTVSFPLALEGYESRFMIIR